MSKQIVGETYCYKAYGMVIQSDIPIKELAYCKDSSIPKPYVKIKQGSIPREISKMILAGEKSGFSKKVIWFDIDKVATYVMYNGEYIIVKPYHFADPAMLELYIVGSCLGFIMLQRGQLAIHGGAVEVANQAIILTGKRGAGKSSLTRAYRKAGYKFLTDDVAAIGMSQVPTVWSGFPYQKLCEDTISEMDYPEDYQRILRTDNFFKYLVPTKEHFIDGERPLRAIIEIVPKEVDKVEIEEIRGVEKFQRIMANIYRGEYISRIDGIQEAYIKQCINLARQVAFYKVIRPMAGFTVQEQMKCIEQAI